MLAKPLKSMSRRSSEAGKNFSQKMKEQIEERNIKNIVHL
jgi:hypothetical protein